MSKIFLIGKTLINIVFKNKLDENNRAIFNDIITTLQDLGLGIYEARETNREFEQIEDNISKSCERILDSHNISSDRKEVIIEQLLNAYENANIGELRFIEKEMDYNNVKKTLLSANCDCKDYLDSSEMELYERLLAHTASIMTNTYANMPSFTTNSVLNLIDQIKVINKKIDKLLKEIDRISSGINNSNVDIFEREYRHTLFNHMNYINIFGATCLRNPLKNINCLFHMLN